MLDPRKLGSLVQTIGWPRAAFLVCVALLASHIVTFEQGIILLLVALAPAFSRYPGTRR